VGFGEWLLNDETTRVEERHDPALQIPVAANPGGE